MNDDGTMARRSDLEQFAEKHGLKIGTIADLIHYRMLNEKTIEHLRERRIQTAFGEFTLHTYLDTARKKLHFALVKGEIHPEVPVPVRVHLPGCVRDFFSVERVGPYPSWSMAKAMARVEAEGCGIIVVILQEESAEQVESELEALFDRKERAIKASETVYLQIGAGSQILRDLGAQKIKVMSAPFRFNAISGFDLEVVEYIECP